MILKHIQKKIKHLAMKKTILALFLSFLALCAFSQIIEFKSLNELRIIKPTISNLINVTNMRHSNFASEVLLAGYKKIGVDGEMIQYSIGSLFEKTGKLEIKKSQYRMMISILWIANDRKRTIFDDLATELEPYFLSIDKDALVFQVDTSDKESYNFILSRKTGSEILLVQRIK
jgi:hypothetical protein